tara:strand:+ start:1590 stop:1841 length:252 start_codon:yes stop_codon:yes gene_type:complete
MVKKKNKKVKKKNKKVKKKNKKVRKVDSAKNPLNQLEKFFSDASKAIEKFLFSPAPKKNKFKYKILNRKKQKKTSRKKKQKKR